MSDQPQTKRVTQSSAAQDQESGARQGDPKDSTDSQAVLSDDIDVPSVKDPISDSKSHQGSAGSNAAPDLGPSEESKKIISEMPLLSGEDTLKPFKTTLLLSKDDWNYINETDYFKFSSDSSANERRFDYATAYRYIEDEEWNALCKAVSWIGFNTKSVKWEDLSQRSRDYISSWANQPQKYIGRQLGHLETAWVWNILWDHLFSPDCAERWHGEPWASYGRVLRDLEGELLCFDCFYSSLRLHIFFFHLPLCRTDDPSKQDTSRGTTTAWRAHFRRGVRCRCACSTRSTESTRTRNGSLRS